VSSLEIPLDLYDIRSLPGDDQRLARDSVARFDRERMNLETVITYEGAEAVHELIVGRELTGENAF